MAERVSNLGHLGLGKQPNALTPVIPTDFAPLYKESMTTDIHVIEDNPVYGSKFTDMQVIQGQRSHKGAFTVLAEPNTAGRFFDMLLTKGTTTGANPYTHPFTLAVNDPNYYTVDISLVSQTVRFFGVQASKISPSWQENEMHLDINVSALGSFQGREIASISTTTVTLSTSYDPAPTTGLVIGDLVRITKATDGSTTDFTISSLTATTVVLNATAASAGAAGDMLVLRPATPSYSIKTPFLWARTEFRFAADAATALSAAQTRLETGSDWTIEHNFESDEGAKRSGGFDPAALIRTLGDASFKIKKFFDTPEEIQRFNALTKRAVVIRHFSESGYELRITINNMKIKSGVKPSLSSGDVLYSEIEYATQYDQTDGQGMDVKVINALPTI